MKLILWMFSLIISTNSFSQIIISGKVVDSETKRPIESVFIQNRHKPEYSALSDKEGIFLVSVCVSDTLDFYRIGYKLNFWVFDEERDVHTILLKPAGYDLPEITITNESADKILQKALINLKKHYTQDTLSYLWHGTLMEKKTKDIRESYALYSAKIGKVSAKTNKKIPFDSQLSRLNHLVNISQQSSYVKSGRFTTDIYPDLRDYWSNNKNYKIVKVNSDNDSLIFIKCEPMNMNSINYLVKCDIIINKLDSVLLYYNACLLNPIAEEDSIKEYDKVRFLIFAKDVKLRNIIEDLIIRKNDKGYYIDSWHVKELVSILVDKKEELLELESISKAIPDKINTAFENKKKKLRGSTGQLFRLPATTTERFWEKYEK
jgi:hypothetical protein